MTRVCAWCNKILGEKDGTDSRITHGICPACSEAAFEEIENFVVEDFIQRRSYEAKINKAESRIC